MNRTTVLLSLLLIASVAACVLWGTSGGVLPFKVFGSPTMDAFMELPAADGNGNIRP